MRILLVDNYDSFTYNLVHYFEQCGAEVRIIRNDEAYENELKQCDRLVLSPGPGLPKESGNLMHIIDKSIKSLPILGVCLGHQALAEYFGAKLRNLNKVHHGQQSELEIIDKDDSLFKGIPAGSKIGHYHSWVVQRDTVPSKLKVTSTSLGNEIMSISHTVLPIKGVQFHPESVLSEHGLQMIRNWLSESASN